MKSTQNTGWLGETATAIALNSMLDSSIYRRLDNLIIPSNRCRTAQIDHAIVSAFGIFVIETKNYAGRIYGDANSPEWHQGLCDISHPFPNPLRQNYGHVKALAGLLNYGNQDTWRKKGVHPLPVEKSHRADFARRPSRHPAVD
jgi:hypothetical protein